MSSSFVDRLSNWATTSGIRIVAIILGAVVFYYVFRTVFRRLIKVAARKVGDSDLVSREQEMRARTLGGIVRGLIIVILVIIVFLMVLRELGYDIGPLLAGAGIAGIAVGLGAQTLVRDLIGGFFVLLEGQFYIDDIIEVGDVRGRVEAIRLRTTLIRDSEGILHIVPNGEMRVVSNLTKGWSRVVLDITIDISEDIDRAIDVIREAARGAAMDDSPVAVYIKEGPDVLGVESIVGKQVTLRVAARTEPFKDLDVAREIRKRVAMAMAKSELKVGDA
ncbi:MAG: mechanosensitive ion channel family protein [Actinomycetota bacterium]|nr:mechanosensitive ion channel family protein [Actinomycetota bacterium]MCL6093017.1 mechanosensitive ion channel family protein [Actinomycetota bacterium]MDA8167346.1 mechanosensitive ion channel family protein [Actinomycetota bacterium]